MSMLIAGSSMAPFLCHNRDYIYFTRPERELRRGDMVFYQRDGGRYVMHRIYKIKPDGYYMVGDAQTQIEDLCGGTRFCAYYTGKAERKDDPSGRLLVGIF